MEEEEEGPKGPPCKTWNPPVANHAEGAIEEGWEATTEEDVAEHRDEDAVAA